MRRFEHVILFYFALGLITGYALGLAMGMTYGWG